jgi:hypothetical protein
MTKNEQKAAIAAFKLIRQIAQGTRDSLCKEFEKQEDKTSYAAQRLAMSIVCYGEMDVTLKEFTRFDENVKLAVKELMS